MSLPTGPQLHPYLSVIPSPPNSLHVGISPAEAVTIKVPEPYSVSDVQWLLSRCDGTRTVDELKQTFGEGRHKVMELEDIQCLLTELAETGVLHLGTSHVGSAQRGATQKTSPPATVGVLGFGQLLEHTRRLVAASHIPIVEWNRSRRRVPRCDVVLLGGTVIPDPLMVKHLVQMRQPFLRLTMVDNRGIVGPLVVPGRSPQAVVDSCFQVPLASNISAASLARLSTLEGRGSLATVTATAAFALSLLHSRLSMAEHEQHRQHTPLRALITPFNEVYIVAPDAGVTYQHALPRTTSDVCALTGLRDTGS